MDSGEHADHMKALRERSGSKNSQLGLVSFLYTLMRDHLPPGEVEALVMDCPAGMTEYSNGWLTEYARDLAMRLALQAPGVTASNPDEHFTRIEANEEQHCHSECGCFLQRDHDGRVLFYQCKVHAAAMELLDVCRSLLPHATSGARETMSKMVGGVYPVIISEQIRRAEELLVRIDGAAPAVSKEATTQDSSVP